METISNVVSNVMSNVTPTMAILGVIIIVVTYYLTYNYLNKDNDQSEIDSTNAVYSLIISIIVAGLGFYAYSSYKPTNSDLLTDDFYSN